MYQPIADAEDVKENEEQAVTSLEDTVKKIADWFSDHGVLARRLVLAIEIII